jgi:hypothetical protein
LHSSLVSSHPAALGSRLPRACAAADDWLRLSAAPQGAQPHNVSAIA